MLQNTAVQKRILVFGALQVVKGFGNLGKHRVQVDVVSKDSKPTLLVFAITALYSGKATSCHNFSVNFKKPVEQLFTIKGQLETMTVPSQ